MGRLRRKRVTVDSRLQGKICLRVFAYWLICALTICLLLSAYQALADGNGIPASSRPLPVLEAAVMSALVLPLVLFDCLCFTNRFVGPIWRIRQELRKIAAGQPATPIRLRDGDDYHDFCDDFNRVVQRIMELESRDGGGVDNESSSHQEQETISGGC